MNVRPRVVASIAAVGLVALAGLGQVGAAHADEVSTTSFTPYTTTQTWYKTGGVAATGDIWPQDLTAITCGGIKQDDSYTINTEQQDTDYKALIAGGVLNSPANDAEFSPAGVVTQLPDCAPVVPTKPADVVKTDISHNLVCKVNPDGSGLYYTTTTTTTTGWVLVDNVWVADKPVVTTDTEKVASTLEQCPLVVVKPTEPAPIVTTVVSYTKPDCTVASPDTDGGPLFSHYDQITTTTTINWTYDATTNTYIQDQPVVTTASKTLDATVAQCLIVKLPNPQPGPDTSINLNKATEFPNENKVVTTAKKEFAPEAAQATDASSLAYTGSNTAPELMIAGFVLLGGLTLVIVANVRRRKA